MKRSCEMEAAKAGGKKHNETMRSDNGNKRNRKCGWMMRERQG